MGRGDKKTKERERYSKDHFGKSRPAKAGKKVVPRKKRLIADW
jgi:hypothetical protein